MASFDFVTWGNTKQVGHWVLETGESGVYRGQCTQTVTQLLKDLGYPGWNAARGNGNQVGASMVARGEAQYVGTNLASIPEGEIHVICKAVGQPGDGHVSVAAVGDIVFEQNVTNNQPTRDFGIGPTYSGRLGRLAEAFRGTRYHYKIIVETDYDNVGGNDGGGEPGDDPTGPNENRILKGRIIDTRKKKTSKLNSIYNHKIYHIVPRTSRDVNQYQ